MAAEPDHEITFQSSFSGSGNGDLKYHGRSVVKCSCGWELVGNAVQLRRQDFEVDILNHKLNVLASVAGFSFR